MNYNSVSAVYRC